MAEKSHIEAIFNRIHRTEEFQRLLRIIRAEPTKDGKVAVVKFYRQLQNEVLQEAAEIEAPSIKKAIIP